MNNTYTRLSIFTTTACNMNCSYCYQGIGHQELIQHPQDYGVYINTLLSLNANNSQTINSIELWGGEPTLYLEEFTGYWGDFITNFPNISEIQLSTNLITSSAVEKIIDLIETIDNNIEHNLTLNLQVSLDGNESINGFNRQLNITNNVINNINNLTTYLKNNQLTYVNCLIHTYSVFLKKTLTLFNSYEDIENWFDFFLDSFDTDIVKFSLFKLDIQSLDWTKEEALKFAQIMEWIDLWRTNNPIDKEYFTWPIFPHNELKICAAALQYGTITLDPTGEKILCHREIADGYKARNSKDIKLTEIYSLLTKQYYKYKDYISEKDFNDSLNIYINLYWCPYQYTKSWDMPREWFLFPMDLYYYGAMNILLKWSREYDDNRTD